MSKSEISRRKFLGRSGTVIMALPLVNSIPAVAEKQTRPTSLQAKLPSRELPVRKRGATVITVELPNDETSDCSRAINDAIDALPEDGGTVWLPYQKTGGSKDCIYRINITANTYTSPKRPNHGQPYGIKLRSNMLLQLEPGVQLRAMPTNVERAYVIFALAPNAHNVVAWNCFSSPDVPSTEPKTNPQAGIGSPAQGHNDPSRTR